MHRWLYRDTFSSLELYRAEHGLRRLHTGFDPLDGERGSVFERAQLIFKKCVTLISVFSLTGVSNSLSVRQRPRFIAKRVGESVSSELHCSHNTTNYERILWYKQDGDKAFRYLGYLNMNHPYVEDDMTGKISFAGDGSAHSALTISNVTLEDSGVYFCAITQHSAVDSPQVKAKTY